MRSCPGTLIAVDGPGRALLYCLQKRRKGERKAFIAYNSL